MIYLVLGNLICIVLNGATQHCLPSPSGHWTTRTKCGIDAATIGCIGVEFGLQALQVPESITCGEFLHLICRRY